jgi:hypothetical protein
LICIRFAFDNIQERLSGKAKRLLLSEKLREKMSPKKARKPSASSTAAAAQDADLNNANVNNAKSSPTGKNARSGAKKGKNAPPNEAPPAPPSPTTATLNAYKQQYTMSLSFQTTKCRENCIIYSTKTYI